jgi:molybdopterin/thiamine biosynthesis adenylyltransferase
VDPDTVALSNLHRQVQFTTADVGAPKVVATAGRAAALNPGAQLELHPVSLDEANAAELVANYDVVLDGTDDFGARGVVNAACVAGGRTLVSGAVARWSGQVGVFRGRPCWRCLVPQPPPDAETCASVGVAGPLTGVVGAAMALEAVKLLMGAGEPLLGRLLLYDGLTGAARTTRVAADPECPVCGLRP